MIIFYTLIVNVFTPCMGKETNLTKHAMNVRKQHDMKCAHKNKEIPILPGYHIEKIDGEPPKVAETYYFEKFERTPFSYSCKCGSKGINKGCEEKVHKKSKSHLKYIEEKQRLCRERHAIQYKKEEKKKRMKELEENITIYDKRIQKIIARKLKDVREYEKLEMELRSIDM